MNYNSPNPTGGIVFTPAANQSGTASIIVTVEDGGLDNELGTPDDNALFNRRFK